MSVSWLNNMMNHLHNRLVAIDDQYESQTCMVREKLATPGYHTTLSGDQWVHPTRSAMEYALLLLDSLEPDRLGRACDVIRNVATLQEIDPTKPTYGIWSWFLEEPLEQMSPPDWNWADFLGARLAQALIIHGDRLPEDLRDVIRASIRHAAYSIFRRNVQPGYTNIAIMGAMVSAAAGEILDDDLLLNYARRRLDNIVADLHANGGFSEYNSPTYTMVVIEETDRLLYLVRDEPCRQSAKVLRDHAWRATAESFHPSTGQWAGPHARTYSDRLSPGTAATLSAAVGVILPGGANAMPRLTPPVLPCPADFVERFKQLPTTPWENRRRFSKRANADVIGVTWFDTDMCLGSVNRGHTWTQARPLIGYIRAAADSAVVLRMKVLWNDI